MKIILRAQLVTDWGDVTEVDIAEFSRPASALNATTLGLSLSDGKAVLAKLQQAVASAQAHELCELHRVCQRCHRWNPIKDYRPRNFETVFGTVHLRCPRIISCPCEPPLPRVADSAVGTPLARARYARMAVASSSVVRRSLLPPSCQYSSRISPSQRKIQSRAGFRVNGPP